MINILRKYTVFLLIPCLALGYSFLIRSAAGPHWLGTNQDPSYQYLFNGVRIIKGLVPNDIVHPGTALQMLIAAICWVLNIGRSSSEIAMRVFMAPEFYLQAVFVVLSLLYFFTSIVLAVYLYRKTGDKLAALLSQLPSLGFYCCSYGLWHVSGECLLVCVANLFCICLMMVFFAGTEKKENTAALWWGVVGGLGVAEKITFIPLLIIPLIVLSQKNKIFFIFVFLASFIIFTFPIITKYPLFLMGNLQILTHLGHQGAGPAGFIEIHSYLSNWRQIIELQLEYALLICAAGALYFWKIASKQMDRGTFFLGATVLGIMFQFALVAKHPGATYVLAGLGLFNALLVLSYWQGPFKGLLGQGGIAFFIIIVIFLRTWQTNEHRKELADNAKDMITFHELIHDQFKKYIFVDYYSSSEPQGAMFLGDEYSGSFDELSGLYPHQFDFNRWTGQIIDFKQRVLSDDLLTQGSGVILVGDEFDFSSTPFSVRLLERRPFENVYLLTGTTEKQALLFHRLAGDYFQRGENIKALACENKAKALHYQEFK